MLKKRRQVAQIGNTDNSILEEISKKLHNAKKDWEDLKNKGKEYRENELLDFSLIEINNDTEKEKKLRKKILQRIKKEQYRNHAFKYLTKHISKGVNRSLKRVYIANDKGEITKTYLKKEEIEEELIKYNK